MSILKNLFKNEKVSDKTYISDNTDFVINTIKFLGIDMINKANSGHPGIVLGAAPIMYSLFRNHIVVDPEDPKYFNRDRFVMSAGHGSALLYPVLHLSGFENPTINDLKEFRQIGSKTPGHPENFHLDAVEATTGPLGQGVAEAVGMAIAETFLAEKYNVSASNPLINHHTYCLFGDGDLQEGVAQEAIALAGRFKLNKLIMLYDSNDVQLDGWLSDSTNYNVQKLFEAYGWNYIKVQNGNKVEDISSAIDKAKQSVEKPTIIEIKTVIGDGSLNQGSSSVHGAPLKKEDIAQLKQKANYHMQEFEVDKSCYEDMSLIYKRANDSKFNYDLAIKQLSKNDQALFEEFQRVINSNFSVKEEWFEDIKDTKDATRNTIGKVFSKLSEYIPNIIGGSADLSGSTKIKGADGNYDYHQRSSRNINYGVREFAMQAINNGISLHGGCIPVSSTFFSFLDYNKAALRLAAVSQIRTIQVYTHDSVFLGEDGPTHQPVEQLWSARLIPNHKLFRPSNVQETIAAFIYAINSMNSPTTIIGSRLAFDYKESTVEESLKGGYVIHYPSSEIKVSLLATGSEVETAIKVSNMLDQNGIGCQVISVPCVELFLSQSKEYINSIMSNYTSFSLEAGSSLPWKAIVDHTYGIDTFGVSGTPDDIKKHFKFDVVSIYEFIKSKI